MIRRPPTRIGATLPAPPMPWVNPGTTCVSGNDTGLPPRDHDESNSLPSLYSTPRYWTETVEAGVAGLPLPTTRSWQVKVAGADVDVDFTFGACWRSFAP